MARRAVPARPVLPTSAPSVPRPSPRPIPLHAPLRPPQTSTRPTPSPPPFPPWRTRWRGVERWWWTLGSCSPPPRGSGGLASVGGMWTTWGSSWGASLEGRWCPTLRDRWAYEWALEQGCGVACFQLELVVGVVVLKLLESGVGFSKLLESES